MLDIVLGTSLIFSHFIFIMKLTVGDPSVSLHLVEPITTDIFKRNNEKGDAGTWGKGKWK